jgi:uncharacterized membrane protein YgcG
MLGPGFFVFEVFYSLGRKRGHALTPGTRLYSGRENSQGFDLNLAIEHCTRTRRKRRDYLQINTGRDATPALNFSIFSHSNQAKEKRRAAEAILGEIECRGSGGGGNGRGHGGGGEGGGGGGGG